MFVDLPLDQLREYRPDVAEPPTSSRSGRARSRRRAAFGGAPEFVPVESPIRHAEVFDVTFPGHGGTPIKAWLLAPRDAPPGAAFVVEYIGY